VLVSPVLVLVEVEVGAGSSAPHAAKTQASSTKEAAVEAVLFMSSLSCAKLVHGFVRARSAPSRRRRSRSLAQRRRSGQRDP
jgi:hypothetical protein